MPPRFPHRLVKPPTKMDKGEMAVFALLGGSVTIGLMQMGSNVLQVLRGDDSQNDSGEDGKKNESAVCPMNWGKTDSNTK